MPIPPFSRLAAGAALALTGFSLACVDGPKARAGAHDPDHRIQALIGDSEAPVLAMATGDTIRLGEEVVAFYKARGWKAAWTDENGILERGKSLIAALHEADAEGLDLVAYHRENIHELIERAKHDVSQDLPVGDLLGNLDLLMTEAFLRYSTDLRRGTIDPHTADIDWRIEREDATDVAFLNDLLENDDVEGTMAKLRPSTPFYTRLKASLARYLEVQAAGGWQPVAPGETLEKGARGERVLQVRRRLAAEGDPTEAPLVASPADPAVFDAKLAQAVEHFQRRHGIVPDGTVGAGTRLAMNVPVAERVLGIKLNLDRWRWLPQDLGSHFVIVNVAGQEMAVIKDGKPAISMNVIVGAVANKTPIFTDTMESVVVNPYWNVPSSIADEELWPKVRADPTYLERNNYEVVSDGSGRRIRQRPGRGNALGKVKFLFPNDMNIYLHDTPTGHLFSRTARAFSHGCIRLERPEDLARYMFQNAAARDAKDFDELLAKGDEQWVSLKEKLPVYIVYFTAWAEEDGSTRFYPDVYERDQAMEKVAKQQLDTVETAPPTALAARPGA